MALSLQKGSLSVANGINGETPMKAAKAKRFVHEATIDYGDQVTFTITPEPGNNIKKVVMDSRFIGILDRLTIADIKRNNKVKITFEQTPLSNATWFETTKGHVVFRDKEEHEKIPNITNDLAENDDDERLIAEPTPAGQYASVKN